MTTLLTPEQVAVGERLFEGADEFGVPTRAVAWLRDNAPAIFATLRALAADRDKWRADMQFMVEKAAQREPTLDGYRELGAKCAALEADRDAQKARADAAEGLLRILGDHRLGPPFDAMIDAHLAQQEAHREG